MKHRQTLTSSLALLAWATWASPAAPQAMVSGWVRNGGSGIGNAAVYMEPLDASPREVAEARTTIDQVHLGFLPDVVVVAPGTEVAFLNSDDVLHNVFGPGFGGVEPFDLGTYPRGDSRSHVFDDAGLHVVLCHIHPEMAAYVLVAATPYKAVSRQDGSFVIEDVPPGRYRMHAWHARHWRVDHSFEISITERGRDDLQIVLGRSATPVMDQP